MLTEDQEVNLSKFMSKILRHTPEQFGITLDIEGFCSIQELVEAITKEKRWKDITEEDIRLVVNNCSKQRYELVGEFIRANYGHSAERLTYEEANPSTVLYHGTNAKVVEQLLIEGIKPMGRKYVHLSESIEFVSYGIKFYAANNGVWLADFVPAKYLERI